VEDCDEQIIKKCDNIKKIKRILKQFDLPKSWNDKLLKMDLCTVKINKLGECLELAITFKALRNPAFIVSRPYVSVDIERNTRTICRDLKCYFLETDSLNTPVVTKIPEE
jgi:hypothetical protein